MNKARLAEAGRGIFQSKNSIPIHFCESRMVIESILFRHKRKRGLSDDLSACLPALYAQAGNAQADTENGLTVGKDRTLEGWILDT